MILVTLGTQDKPFTRLLEAIQKQINNGTITDEVIVQAGNTKFHSNKMQIFDLIPIDDFDKLMQKCDLLITHGGVGSIIAGLKANKTVIAAPRLAQYKEHLNDHQKQIIENFSNSGYIIALNDVEHLDIAINTAQSFHPKKYISNTANMIKLIKNEIDKN